MDNQKPIIGITIGDFNGIGPEITLKTLSNSMFLKWCTPVVYGSQGILSQYVKILNLEGLNFNRINDIKDIKIGKINVINCWNEDHQINPGTATRESGDCAFSSLKAAVKDLKENSINALVTAPINKKNIQSEEFNFPGHTEYLMKEFDKPDGLMVLTGEKLTVAALSGHVAFKEISDTVKKDRIIRSAKGLSKMLSQDMGIEKPRLAILGLNPHAGDNGLFGHEEEKEIIPAIQELKDRGILAFGPYGPDGFFGSGDFEKFDGILGMYHDQVLIPFKLMEFETGVNYTSGLGAIRTSPDHGTAFDIAGKNVANARSMKHAMFKALDILKHRSSVN